MKRRCDLAAVDVVRLQGVESDLLMKVSTLQGQVVGLAKSAKKVEEDANLARIEWGNRDKEGEGERDGLKRELDGCRARLEEVRTRLGRGAR